MPWSCARAISQVTLVSTEAEEEILEVFPFLGRAMPECLKFAFGRLCPLPELHQAGVEIGELRGGDHLLDQR